MADHKQFRIQAASHADTEFWSRHQEEQPRRLTNAPADVAFKQEWLAIYHKKLAELRTSNGTSSEQKYVKTGCAECHTKKPVSDPSVKFLLDFREQDRKFSIYGDVNRKGSEALPYNDIYSYDIPGGRVDGNLDLVVGQSRFTLIKDLGIFDIEQPSDVRVFVGTPDDKTAQTEPDWVTTPVDLAGIQWSEQEEPAEVAMILEATDNPGIREGTHDLSTEEESVAAWLWRQLKGTNLPPLFGTIGEIAVDPQARSFLKDFLIRGRFYVKTSSSGKTLIIFKGYPGLRTFFKGTSYTADKVKVISTYANIANKMKPGTFTSGGVTALKSSLPTKAAKGTLLAFIFVAAVDVIEWWFKPANERFVTDLLVELGFDGASMVISSVAGLLAGAAVVALAVSAPVWAVVAVGIGVGLAVGFGLDWLDSKFELKATLQKRARAFIGDMHLMEAVSQAHTNLKRIWSSVSWPEAKIFELREVIKKAPSLLRRQSKAVTPEFVGAIILDVLQQHTDIRLATKKALVDVEAGFIQVYEGWPERFEKWSLRSISGIDIEELGIGIGHMNSITVYDLVDNNYVTSEAAWKLDRLDVALRWLSDDQKVPVLVAARIARISQYWFNRSGGAIDISEKPEIIASLYYVGLATAKGVHADPQPNNDGTRITSLMPKVKGLIGAP